MYIIAQSGERIDINSIKEFRIQLLFFAMVTALSVTGHLWVLGVYINEEKARETLEHLLDALRDGKGTFYMPPPL